MSNLAHMDIPNVSGVYLLTDTVTGATYVGSSRHIRTRLSLHFHDMRRRPNLATYRVFQKTYEAHGATAFTATLLETCDPDCLLTKEREWLARLAPSENMYACADGRPGATPQAVTAKSLAAERLWANPEYRAKAVAARKGKAYSKGHKCTPEQIANRRKAGRISNMKRAHGERWVEEYLRRYPEHAGDIHA